MPQFPTTPDPTAWTVFTGLRGPSRMRRTTAPVGLVQLVGVGPGDPDLLTVRALRAMQQAEVIVHDRLVSDAILELARSDARYIDVGKQRGRHPVPQAAINRLLADQARAGRRVVRLKGGDPFVFGRGGEELDYLRRRNIAVEVIPGITAALGCAAAAGIPLTHRDLAPAVTFISGHGKDGEPAHDWAALARSGHTLAVYMGVATAATVVRRLLHAGLDPATPAAVIENGTRTGQRVIAARLAALPCALAEADVRGPALILIGEVARFADHAAIEPDALRAAV